MTIAAPLARLEALRGDKVLVLAASHLELDLLPALYDTLRELGRQPRLCVLLQCRGGAVIAARRIALLLHAFTERLAFIVPHHCESAGTILALSAHEIIAGPTAIFSPVDPQIHAAGDAGSGPSAISAEDVRRFGEMAQAWFGVEAAAIPERALGALTGSLFPTTLTAFYRATAETRAVCEELLGLARQTSPEKASEIAERLTSGFHSHEFPLTGPDLAELGLPVVQDPATEDPAWEISATLRARVGGGSRASADAAWIDTLVATAQGARQRRRTPGPIAPCWEACDLP